MTSTTLTLVAVLALARCRKDPPTAPAPVKAGSQKVTEAHAEHEPAHAEPYQANRAPSAPP